MSSELFHNTVVKQSIALESQDSSGWRIRWWCFNSNGDIDLCPEERTEARLLIPSLNTRLHLSNCFHSQFLQAWCRAIQFFPHYTPPLTGCSSNLCCFLPFPSNKNLQLLSHFPKPSYITSFSTLQLKARENHVKISKCWISKLRQTHSEEVQNQNLSLPIRFWFTKSSQWQYHSSAMHKVWIIQQKGGFWEAKSPLNPSRVVVFQTGMQLIPLPGYPLAAEVDCLRLLLAWFHPKDITISTLQSCSTM